MVDNVNKKLKHIDENSQSPAFNKIAAKSYNLKAALKSKYLIYKIERSFLNNQ